MKYMQNGGFQKNPLMRLTLLFALLFLVGFVTTNFLLYFAKMDLTPKSVNSYYNGSEENFRPARTYQSMLEVTHGHLAMMALVLLLLTHLLIFVPFSGKGKVILISTTFLSALFEESAGWLTRFVHPGFAWVKVISFSLMQASFIFLVATLVIYLIRSVNETNQLKSKYSQEADGG